MFMINLTAPKTGPQQITFDIFNLGLHAIPAEWSKMISSLAHMQKAWKDPSQACLFHRVVITNLMQLYHFIATIIQHLGPKNRWCSVTTLNFRVKHVTLVPSVKLGVQTPTMLNMISNVLPMLEDLRSIVYNFCWFNPLDFYWLIIGRWS